MLKAEVLSSSPQRSSATPLQSQRRSLAAQQCPSTPGMGRDDSEASESENRNSQWESLMVNGQDKVRPLSASRQHAPESVQCARRDALCATFASV